MDMMETERLCELPSFVVLLGPPFHDPEPACIRPTPMGAFRERVARCPLTEGTGLEIEVTLFLVCNGGPFLGLSPLGTTPLVAAG